MNISAITKIGFNNNQKIRNNNLKPLANDTFIKTSSMQSFKGISSFNETYEALKADMTNYIMNEEYTVKGIQSIVQKYSPTTEVKDFKELPSDVVVSDITAAYTKHPLAFNPNNFAMYEMPKTTYLRLTSGKSKENRIILLDRILHESTHILQEESPEKKHKLDFYNKYLAQETNPMKAISTIQAAPMVFKIVEDNVLRTWGTGGKNIGSLPKAIEDNPKKGLEKAFKKVFNRRSDIQTDYFIGRAMDFAKQKFGEFDSKTVLEYLALQGNNELEAYQNALNSNKEQLNLKCNTDFDVRLEGYRRIIECAESHRI